MALEPAGAVDGLLRALCAVALDGREDLDRLDGASGDADAGSTLARGAAALAAAPPSGDAVARLRGAAEALTGAMGGSSGPMWGVAALRGASVLEDAGGEGATLDAALVGRALEAGAGGITEYGGAQVGDKTFLDALVPLAQALAGGASIAEAAAAARAGAEATADLEARAGRSSYAGARSRGAVDPGAEAVARLAERVAGGTDGVPAWEELATQARAMPGEAEEGAPAERSGFVDHPADLVSQAVDGLVAAHPTLVRRLPGTQVVVRAEVPRDRVAIVSGGGAGHEPMHAALVGEGMLTAACSGAVFTSPSPSEITAAAREVAVEPGILFLVKQYTGDVLNFRLAAELAADEGVRTRTVIVADDVALPADTPAGRRGTGATVLAEKVAGARAAAGGSLEEVATSAEHLLERTRSFGVALHGTQAELGVGIHGEPGRDPVPTPALSDLAPQLVEPVLAELDAPDGAELLVLLSGLGGTPPLELHALFAGVAGELQRRGLAVARSLVGDWITSLAQPGAVLTVCVLDDELRELWDAPVRTPALTR